jgi:hypothetical protein
VLLHQLPPFARSIMSSSASAVVAPTKPRVELTLMCPKPTLEQHFTELAEYAKVGFGLGLSCTARVFA